MSLLKNELLQIFGQQKSIIRHNAIYFSQGLRIYEVSEYPDSCMIYKTPAHVRVGKI
jgi:hypothetical protein